MGTKYGQYALNRDPTEHDISSESLMFALIKIKQKGILENHMKFRYLSHTRLKIPTLAGLEI